MLGLLWGLLKFVLGICIFFAIFHATVTHFLAWYEMRLSKLEQNESYSVSLFQLSKSLMIESCCNLFRFLLTPFANKKLSLSNTKTNQTPILLIHGYLQNQLDWIWFKQQLEKNRNLGPVYTLNLCPAFNSISFYASNVQTKVEEILTATEQSEIILIGHSMGGLVASYYSEFLAKPKVVKKIITLGTPFQGTKTAALGYGQNVKEMFPRSKFLNLLNEKIAQSKIPYHFVASRMDNLIIPWHSAIPPHLALDAENNLILEDYGHLRLLVSRQIIEQVTTWVR